MSAASSSSRRDILALAGACALAPALPAFAAREERPEDMSGDEVVRSGHRFFGSIARNLALAVQEAARRWGQPNAYVLGQEASGAFVGGLRYGEGVMFTRNAGKKRVYWQGPTLGFDAGADGDRTMMLVYNLPSAEAIYTRFGGVDGSAYLVGGLGLTELMAGDIVLAPIRSGVGARLGVSFGYLKFTREATWNPF
ncbi:MULTISPECIES: DUF1134 domain-containing protein [Methylosinus]|uniref:DUF1134 domain-containing protein n=1 Tax=Methylosinus trichosporium (strain ATCC 35070 / NCIMB 11131 / UNIQEM 75 / OB3b) TaxID=595536 RepID=A0A2D2CWZ3_METT3|nr:MULTISPECIES: DUF1134 domain-containing protein [Methylosinus]ATQ67260.1 DUF1134 domain-containing protein [Methylosinus trichosporium OB3b]OBS52577.1 hypothetical protein A8B73_10375 [Methylosinus sp. 3S-1]